MCHSNLLPTSDELEELIAKGLAWSDKDVEYATREMIRSVKHISSAADLLSRQHMLLSLNSMPRLVTQGCTKDG